MMMMIPAAAKLLIELNAEIENMSVDLFPLDVEVKPTEKYLCTVEDDFLKKLYMLHLLTRREAEMLEVELRYQTRPDHSVKHQLELKDYLINCLFWYLLKQQHSLFQESYSSDLALRSGWKVVSFKSVNDILRRFMEE